MNTNRNCAFHPPRAFWALAPAALAGIELWHPVIRSGTAAGLEPLAAHADTWLLVHLVQLVLFGLTALAVDSFSRIFKLVSLLWPVPR
jgi:hypothetical protein